MYQKVDSIDRGSLILFSYAVCVAQLLLVVFVCRAMSYLVVCFAGSPVCPGPRRSPNPDVPDGQSIAICTVCGLY